MAYRFKANDPSVTEGLRRIAAYEFGLIEAAFSDTQLPPGRKVHEGRKATKRLRSLIRLVGPVFPEARREVKSLREAAGRLSALRDRGALLETLAQLKLPDDAAASLRGALVGQPISSAAEQKRLLRTFRAEMMDVSRRAAGWSLDEDGWDALAPGLERCHHRLRRSVKAAARSKGDEPVHDLRKRAKDHWHQTLLLRGVFPGVMDTYAAAAAGLCDDLGDWRDLGLLDAELRALPAHVLTKPDASAALSAISRARRRALRRGQETVSRLAAETPDAYLDRLHAWWRASR